MVPLYPKSYCLLLAMAGMSLFPNTAGWIPAIPKTTASKTRTFMSGPGKRNLFDYDVDYYNVLNVTRGASNEDITRNYQIFERLWNPSLIYQQTPELQFQPASLRVKELKEYLESSDVSTATCIDKQDLVDLAKRVYQRTGKVDDELQKRRQPNQDRYDLLKQAYKVLSDPDERRRYNLSGDWGVGGPPSGMGSGGRFVGKQMTNFMQQGFNVMEGFGKGGTSGGDKKSDES